MQRDTVWSFETARFRVECNFLPEDIDPSDSFEFQDDIDAVRNGDVLWFCAEVRVLDKNTSNVLGRDILGGCAYRDVDEFIAAHRDPDPTNRNCAATNATHTICHYFPEMVRLAIADARHNATKFCDLKVRA